MGPMGTSALRNIRALVARDLLDAVRNPTTLMSCAAGALIAAFFGRVVAGAPRLSAAEGDAFALVAALCIAPAFAGCVVELYVMAEEREPREPSPTIFTPRTSMRLSYSSSEGAWVRMYSASGLVRSVVSMIMG